jgi:hypothetical protein
LKVCEKIIRGRLIDKIKENINFKWELI